MSSRLCNGFPRCSAGVIGPLCLLVVAWGCGDKVGTPALRLDPLAVRLTLVDPDVQWQGPGAERDVAPDFVGHRREVVEFAEGKQYWAVVARRSHPFRDTLWLVDPISGSVRKVEGIRAPPSAFSDQNIRVMWDASGARLAGTVTVKGGRFWTQVGVIQLPSCVFDALIEVEDTNTVWVWNGDVIVFSYSTGREHRILTLDPDSRSSRAVYRERAGALSEGCSFPASLLPSPGGRYLAFTRSREDNSGIWLLDLVTGRCVQLTSEDARPYVHRLDWWDDSTHLTFSRGVFPRHGGQSRYERYRVELRVPPGSGTQGARPR